MTRTKLQLLAIQACLLMLMPAVFAQQEIELCNGSGQHCMEIRYGDITVKLVKGKNKPEVIIKSNQQKSMS